MKKICVITGARAEYGLLKPIMQAIKDSNVLDLQVIATTMHMSPHFGETYKQIEEDGFVINEKIDNLSSLEDRTSMAKSAGLAMMLLSDALVNLSPDAIMVLGDRYETFAAASTAVLLKIPIIHLHGGERTEGAIDEQLRHSLTKLSFLHFTSTNEYRQRVIQMGEDPSRVICSGAPGIDNIINVNIISLQDLSKILGWKIPSEFVLVIYHPETYSSNSAVEDINKLLKTIKDFQLPAIFVYANADFGGQSINKSVEQFVSQNTSQYTVVKNLSMEVYLSILKQAKVLIGNSSSGIIEAASLGTAVVNIGDRQKGRLRARNVVDCSFENLHSSLEYTLKEDFQRGCEGVLNPYGEGKATSIIVQTLITTEFKTQKTFIDEPF